MRENNIDNKVSKISLSLIVVGFCAAVNIDSQHAYTTPPVLLPPQAIKFYSLPQKHTCFISGIKERRKGVVQGMM